MERIMTQQEMDKVLRASLRFAPTAATVAEVAANGEAHELMQAWGVGHPGGAVSLNQNDR
ncbi:hypothetical protein PSP6_690108 [Paraburkholderia tropica]|uniref:hypothetical protein n=1 Tax=Paraburkholderia tropica TaxID=92647 RepID=UPI001CB3F536|nr:hypothetical protein [Paraburkholderia tropica]CAG9235951.1 hypothetical protein PSP6_690108 [Paraburkholderia tropica]